MSTDLDHPVQRAEDARTDADELQSGLGWAGDMALAQRVFDVLEAEYAQSPGRPERMNILKALGRVPLVAAGEFLLDASADLGESVSKLSPLRWCAGQVYNSGAAGRALLRARLVEETDPFRRMDLLAFVWQDHSEESLNCMLSILEDETRQPFEQLYVAELLTRMRASERVAGAIKRLYLGSTHREVRPALQCLLWTWFGQHNE